jgi:hypothetical protein
MDEDAVAAVADDPASADNVLRIRHYCSDGGPDQISYRKFFISQGEADPLDVRVDTTCVKHQAALVVKSGLRRCDDWLKSEGVAWRLYSAIAKLMHILRDSCRTLFLVYARLFGALFAKNTVPDNG